MTDWNSFYRERHAEGDFDYDSSAEHCEITGATFALLGGVKGRTVLDLGCGAGAQAIAMAAHGAVVTGVELVEEQVARNRSEWPQVRWLQGSIDHPGSWPDGVFDRVTVIQALQYTEDPAVSLPKIWSRVAGGGRLVIASPNAECRSSRVTGDRWFRALSATWLREALPRTLPGCKFWTVRGFHYASDRVLEVFDHGRVDAFDPPPADVIACFVRH